MEIKSLANGARLNSETWNDFIERLKYQHQGEGVNDHGELSVCVESAYWCWELREILDAMLDGKIKYVGDE